MEEKIRKRRRIGKKRDKKKSKGGDEKIELHLSEDKREPSP